MSKKMEKVFAVLVAAGTLATAVLNVLRNS